ncbi:MAG: protein translocase subunit SecF, partial [Planctomycetaceae bacterium]|nr:protein translocase subunit SecF [Planctomycetaceae bacterium]
GTRATLFRMRTVEQDPKVLADAINQAFEGTEHKLVRQQMTVGEIKPISDAAAVEGETTVEELDNDPFTGGHEVTLTFREPISALSVANDAAHSLGALQGDDGSTKYEESASIVRAINTADSGSLTGKGNEFVLKVGSVVPQEDIQTALASLAAQLAEAPNFEEVNTFDTSVATETQLDALLALFFSLVAIIAYLWFRFQRVTFGIACAIAIVHDVLFVVGSVAIGAYLSGNAVGGLLGLQEFKVNMPMIAAFMTIVGYSLNDTIVVFDRVREIRGKNPALTAEMINTSLNQTLSRTILTSLTTLIVVAILYVIGGEGIHGFAYCLLIGIVVGTYSTIYIAAPMLLWLMNRQPAVR